MQLHSGKGDMIRSSTYSEGVVLVLLLIIAGALINPALAGNSVEIRGKIVATEVIADFTGEPRAGTVPLMVQFKDRSQGKITSWAWDFDNDGTVDSTRQNPRHIYTAPGLYTVKLTVTGPSGSDIEVKEQYITVRERRPVAFFIMNRHIGKVPLTIQFTDRSLFNPTSWFWWFGDGTTSDKRHPQHTYTKPGFYLVTLKASNSGGSDYTHRMVFAMPNWMIKL